VRLQEVRPDELHVSQRTLVHVDLDLLEGDKKNQGHERKDQERSSADVEM
jgi:hypothetical protein